jgi:hypothetical protein
MYAVVGRIFTGHATPCQLPGNTIEILPSSGDDSSTLGSGHLVAPQGPTPSNGMHAAVLEGLLLTKDDTPSIDAYAALSNPPDDPNAKMARSVMTILTPKIS